MVADTLDTAEIEALLREIAPMPRARRRHILVRRPSGELEFIEDQSDWETICLQAIDEIFGNSSAVNY